MALDRPLVVYCVCGYGCGTSLILKMSLDDVFSIAGIRAETITADLTSAAGLSCDIICTSDGLFNEIKTANPQAKTIQVDDFLDKEKLASIVLPIANEIIENK
jgi:PTS system ascorbate-specific IIB component